jgi:hypothetical protein
LNIANLVSCCYNCIPPLFDPFHASSSTFTEDRCYLIGNRLRSL